jgi:malonyl CoA-acyl carrier protein transacylase
MKTYMFPGQGSQSRRMGENLFEEFQELTDKASNILGYSIKELCLNDPQRQLNKTQFTQPAIYVVSALSYYKKLEETSEKPDFVIGHSLGEFNALLASECYTFESGLKLVKKRGELMSQATDGGMAAILNSSKEEIEQILQDNQLAEIEIANYNTPSQIVISGSKEEIGKAEPYFQKGEILYYPLNTGGAFHSRFMQPASKKFAVYLKKFKFSPLQIPVISNVTAQPYKKNSVVKNLSKQIDSGVRWSDSIQYLMKLAEQKESSMQFEEVGNNDVLTKIVDTLKRELAPIPVKEQTAQPTDKKETSQKTVRTKNVETPSEAKEIKKKEKLDAISVEEKVSSWNAKYPVGTKAKSKVIEGEELETRTEAVILFGHRAAVYMKDYNGYFDLNEVVPVIQNQMTT